MGIARRLRPYQTRHRDLRLGGARLRAALRLPHLIGNFGSLASSSGSRDPTLLHSSTGRDTIYRVAGGLAIKMKSVKGPIKEGVYSRVCLTGQFCQKSVSQDNFVFFGVAITGQLENLG